MTDPVHNIFLSYASQDAAVAARLGEALRAAGLEVWFDQSELRGGDAWDQMIRQRIRECALFMPVISANTQTRLEGYFRLEWRLAVDRTHLMADGKAFLVPVVIDEFDESHAQVPEAFRAVQWSRLPAGQATPAFITRISELLSTDPAVRAASVSAAPLAAAAPAPAAAPVAAWQRFALPLVVILAALGAVALLVQRLGHRTAMPAPPVAAVATPVGAAPSAPAHSLAVLPFTNLSGDPKDEYFSDGLSEELLNTLASVPGLQVAARTSSFSFKGKNEAVGAIAHKLNVATVLEGSVRRDKSHVRISTQLIDAGSGFQRWSQTYDRDLKDVLALQSEIATAVAGALRVKLLQTDVGSLEGGTENPQAFDAFLRGEELARQPLSRAATQDAQSAYDTAIRLDPSYANAFLGRARVRTLFAFNGAVTQAEYQHGLQLALSDARQAVALAPTLGVAHSAIGNIVSGQLDFAGAAAELDKGIALSPGDARTYSLSATFLASMGRFDEAIARGTRAVELDPLNPESHRTLAYVYFWARHYAQSVESGERALALHAKHAKTSGWLGLAYAGLGNFEAARVACEVPQPEWINTTCLAIVYEKLGRHADAQAAFALLQRVYGEAVSYQKAEVYAQRGDLPQAQGALERALALRDPGLVTLKVDPLLDPLRGDPQFKALQAQLHFPD